jgi:hypothetical protein
LDIKLCFSSLATVFTAGLPYWVQVRLGIRKLQLGRSRRRSPRDVCIDLLSEWLFKQSTIVAAVTWNDRPMRQ